MISDWETPHLEHVWINEKRWNRPPRLAVCGPLTTYPEYTIAFVSNLPLLRQKMYRRRTTNRTHSQGYLADDSCQIQRLPSHSVQHDHRSFGFIGQGPTTHSRTLMALPIQEWTGATLLPVILDTGRGQQLSNGRVSQRYTASARRMFGAIRRDVVDGTTISS